MKEIYAYDLDAHLEEALSEVKQLLVDLNGGIWIAARQLLHYDVQTDELQVIGARNGLRGQGISTLLEDAAGGYIWVGTQRGGLYRFNNDRYSRLGK